MGGCGKLTEVRKEVEKDEMEEWQTRHLRNRKKEKGDVRVERGREKEEGEKEEKLASLFGIYDI